jgi:hypothetical protein
MEAAGRDGSDAAGGGRSHLTGDHRQPPGTEPCEFLRRKLQRQTTNAHRHVVSLIKRLIMIYYYFNDTVLSENIKARRRMRSRRERGTMAAVR